MDRRSTASCPSDGLAPRSRRCPEVETVAAALSNHRQRRLALWVQSRWSEPQFQFFTSQQPLRNLLFPPADTVTRKPLGVVVWAQSMTNAHVCLGCAGDLASVRAIRDPHYALPMVICPGCGKASVRRTHPFHARWIASLRIGTAITALVLQHVVALTLIGSTLAVIAGVLALGYAAMIGEVTRQAMINLGISIGAVSIVTGAWLTAGLSHILWWRAWLGWILLVVLLVGFGAAVSLAVVAGGVPDLVSWIVGTSVIVVAACVPLGIIMALAVAGIPLGKLMLMAHRGFVRGRFRWRRRRRALGATVL